MAALQDHFSIVKSSLASHYDPIFNFYFAKDVNDLCYSRVHAKEVIRFEDLLRYDCEDEMLKRYYHLKEASRINLLAEYYARNRVLQNQAPLLYLTSGAKPMHKRIKRRIKRQAQRQQQDEADPFDGDQTFLKSIHSEDLRKTQQEPNLLQDVSMDTEVYDIYVDGEVQTSKFQIWKNILPLQQQQQDDYQLHDALPQNLVMDFRGLDHERILNDYNVLKALNPEKITKDIFPQQPSKYQRAISIQNKNQTVLKKSQPKNLAEGKMYIIKGLQNGKKTVRLDQQYLQEIGAKKQRKFIERFQTQIHKQVMSPKQKSNRLKIYPVDNGQRFHKVRSKNRDSQVLLSPPSFRDTEYFYEIQGKSPQSNDRFERLKTSGNQPKWRNSQYQALKRKAQQIQQQALRTIYRFSNKNVRSTDYLTPSHRQTH